MEALMQPTAPAGWETAGARPSSRLRTSVPATPDAGMPLSVKHSVESLADFLGQPQPEAIVNPHVADRAASTFRVYDVEGRGFLDRNQMTTAIAEMGAVHGLSAKAIEDVLAMDPSNNRNQRYSLNDFLTMYMRMGQYQAKLAREGRIRGLSQVSDPPEGAETNPVLRQVFCSYCQFTRGVSRIQVSETEMVTQQLHKMCLDVGVLGEGAPLTHASVDIAFTRCKSPQSRRLTYEQWLRVLCVLSDESGWNLFDMLEQLCQRLGQKGLPAPVDPDTVMPLKHSNLPKLRAAPMAGGTSRLPSGGGGDPGRTAAGGTRSEPGGGGKRPSAMVPRGGPSPQRPPRFSNLGPPSPVSPAGLAPSGVPLNGQLAWGPSPPSNTPSTRGPRRSQDHLALAAASGSDNLPSPTSVPIARMMAALDGKAPWSSVQIDPDALPPWLQQLLERLQQLEAKVDATGASAGSASISERQMGQIKIMMQSQLQQAAAAAMSGLVEPLEQRLRGEVEAAVAAGRSSLPPEESELASALAELRAGLQEDVKLLVRTVRDSSSGSDSTQDRLAALEKLVADLRQRQADDVGLLREQLQQLQAGAATPDAAATTLEAEEGKGAGAGGVGLEGRVDRCEQRLDGHDAELAALRGALEEANKQREAVNAAWKEELKRQEERLLAAEAAAAKLLIGFRSRGAEGTAVAAADAPDASSQGQPAGGQEPDSAEGRLAALEQASTALAARVDKVEEQCQSQATGLASAAASAASAAAKASEASVAAAAGQTAGAAAATRLDAVEAQLTTVAAQAKEAAQAAAAAAVAAAAATAAAPTATGAQASAAGVAGLLPELQGKVSALQLQVQQLQAAAQTARASPDPALAAKIQALEAQVSALGTMKPDAAAVGADALPRLQTLEQQLAAVTTALQQHEATAAATAAALAQLQQQVAAGPGAGGEPQALSAAAAAELTEQLRNATAHELAEHNVAVNQRLQAVEGRLSELEGRPRSSSAGGSHHEEAAREALEAMGLTGRVVAQLVRLAALGIDVTILGELFKKQTELETEVRRRPASATTVHRSAGSVSSVAAEVAVAGELSAEASQSANVALGSSSKALTEASRALAEATKAADMAARVEAELQALRKSAGLMQQAMQVLRREIDALRPPLARAEAAGKAAAEAATAATQRSEELGAFIEALAGKHDTLEGEVQGIKAAKSLIAEIDAAGAAAAAAAAASSASALAPGTPDGRPEEGPELRSSTSISSTAGGNASGSPQLASVEAKVHQLVITVGETTGRIAAVERDIALALSSYAKMIDLKESENHLLDRHQQLHDEVEVVKANIQQIHEDVFSLKAAVVVQSPGAARTSALSGVKHHSLVLGIGGGEAIMTSEGMSASAEQQQLASQPSMQVRPRTARISGNDGGAGGGGVPVTVLSAKSAPNGALGRPPMVPGGEYSAYEVAQPHLQVRKRVSGTGQQIGVGTPTGLANGGTQFTMQPAVPMPASNSRPVTPLTRPSPALGQPSGITSASRPSLTGPTMSVEHGWSEAQYKAATAAGQTPLTPGTKLQ